MYLFSGRVGGHGQKKGTSRQLRFAHGRADRPSRSDQIFGLDLACPHLTIFGTFFDVLHKLLLLVLKLDTLPIELTLGLFKGSLVFP